MSKPCKGPERPLGQIAPAIGVPIDRIGFDRKARLAESAGRARHVHRGRDQEPALAGLRIDQRLGEARVLGGVARTLFELHARPRDAKALQQVQHERRFRRPGENKIGAAAGEHDPRIRETAGERRDLGDALGAGVERNHAAGGRALRLDGAAQYDYAVRRSAGRDPGREALLEDQHQDLADRQKSKDHYRAKARKQQPPARALKARPEQHEADNGQKRDQMRRDGENAERLGQNEEHQVPARLQAGVRPSRSSRRRR